ncbi:FMN-dependent NADH-azoreductase [Allokutzneria oryzae]|uniref:FMN dependent NADH:quinone oxidoreductase n=1 Tax=Allokutzneria oryzae TaxID=1378989 RepID=A0ABV6A3C3_9PSEU
MSSLLHLDSSSSRIDDSVSRRLTSLFADTWRKVHSAAGYRYRDLAVDPVPLVGPAYCALGRRLEREGLVPADAVARQVDGPDEQREWALTLPLITELLSADTVLLGVPMYNFSIPASLKAWIDRITFPGAYTDPATGASLLRGTRVVVVTARGGSYGPGTPREAFDFQEPYLRAYFGDLGVSTEDMLFVHAEMTLATIVPKLDRFRAMAESSLAAAQDAVSTLAKCSF